MTPPKSALQSVILGAAELGTNKDAVNRFAEELGRAWHGTTTITELPDSGEIEYSFPRRRDVVGNISGPDGAFLETVKEKYAPRLKWRVSLNPA